MYKTPYIKLISGFLLVVVAVSIIAIPQTINADSKDSKTESVQPTLIHNGHLTICKLDKTSMTVVKTVKMVITGYSSTVGQTDDTPFITASGDHVEDGIIATNMFPFGTTVRIPALYGDKVFTVKDRMNKRYNGKFHVDIWFPEYQQAKNFGAKITDIEILEN